jgi:hypothetical protein
MQRLVVGWLVLSVSLSAAAQETSAPVASAETPAVDTAAPELDQAARLLFEAGSRAYSAGRFAEALMRYRNAYQLSQRPQLLYNIAVCHDRLEHKQDAADAYEAFLAALPNSSRAPIARSRLEILREALAARAPVDQSAHVDEASRGVEPPDAAGDPPPDAGGAHGTVEPESSSPSLAGPLVAFGIGGAGLVTFAVAGLITRGRYDDCRDGGCSVSELDDVDSSALFADIGLGVAVAGVAVGVVLLLVGGDGDGGEHARVTPTVGADRAGLMFQGRF